MTLGSSLLGIEVNDCFLIKIVIKHSNFMDQLMIFPIMEGHVSNCHEKKLWVLEQNGKDKKLKQENGA